MRKKLMTLVGAAAAALALVALVPAAASANHGGWKNCSGYAGGYTRGGYELGLGNFRGYDMNCASVRYAARHLRNRMARTWYGNPNVSFFDGYVRWNCFANGAIECYELQSGTTFRVYRFG